MSLDTFNNPGLSVPQIGESVRVAFSQEACLLLDQAVVAAEPDLIETGV